MYRIMIWSFSGVQSNVFKLTQNDDNLTLAELKLEDGDNIIAEDTEESGYVQTVV